MTMTSPSRRAVLIGGMSLLASPAYARGITRWDISRIQVRKAARRLELVGGGHVLKGYDMRLGFSPEGRKHFQGDGRTPEGPYHIDRRNPRSAFYLSLGLSYPNARDRSYAAAHGRSPGGDIFIHGQLNGRQRTAINDWTNGCIAVSNQDMDELWHLIPVGCPIHIYA